MAKATYGTGCFVMMNTGEQPLWPEQRLVTTLAWKRKNESARFALEGSIFSAGSVVQWLRDGLGIIKASAEVEDLALRVESSDGLVLVPAFTGLGAPYWEPGLQAAILGLGRNSNRSHIARAALECIAFQVYDVMEACTGGDILKPEYLLADGGASANNLLMQIQADVLQTEVFVPDDNEATVRGAAAMAWTGYGGASWKQPETGRLFKPQRDYSLEIARWKESIYGMLAMNPKRNLEAVAAVE